MPTHGETGWNTPAAARIWYFVCAFWLLADVDGGRSTAFANLFLPEFSYGSPQRKPEIRACGKQHAPGNFCSKIFRSKVCAFDSNSAPPIFLARCRTKRQRHRRRRDPPAPPDNYRRVRQCRGMGNLTEGGLAYKLALPTGDIACIDIARRSRARPIDSREPVSCSRADSASEKGGKSPLARQRHALLRTYTSRTADCKFLNHR